MSKFHLFLIIIIILLIVWWSSESKWMEENWPELEMDIFWNDGGIEFH